jgi:hypothetical protein
MNVLKALFNSSFTESSLFPESFEESSYFPEIEPLWINIQEVQAIVTQTIAPQVIGRVKFRGTRWRALSDRPYALPEGTLVQVIGRHRTSILIVQPVNPSVV